MATLIVPQKFSAAADAEALRTACEGWGTDEKAIIKILGHRNAAEKKQIKEAYQQLYKQDLIKTLQDELSGDFERSVYRWILDPPDRDAVLAHAALIAKSTPDYGVIIEISCNQTPEEVLAVKRAYQVRYKHSLEEDLAVHISGDLRKLLVGLVGVHRYHGGDIDPKLSKSEANLLDKAIDKKELNNPEIIRIVTTRNKAQIIATLNHYQNEHKSSVLKHLENDHGDTYLAALRTTIISIEDPKIYYEKVLRDAIDGIGTDEDALTRVIVTRAEKDLKEIKELYHKNNSVTLESAVAGDTSGDYADFLLTLLGKET